MDILTNKTYKQYDKLSRYTQFPYYYNTIDNKYIYGTTTQLYKNTQYSRYKVKQNDTYDLIALMFYNNPTYFWVICNFNDVIDPFTRPPEGTYLKIPVISNIEFKEN